MCCPRPPVAPMAAETLSPLVTATTCRAARGSILLRLCPNSTPPRTNFAPRSRPRPHQLKCRADHLTSSRKDAKLGTRVPTANLANEHESRLAFAKISVIRGELRDFLFSLILCALAPLRETSPTLRQS